jgi:hypothetical protein
MEIRCIKTIIKAFVMNLNVKQGWARDLKARDRDETETSPNETETRPRRCPVCPRRDRDETRDLESRDRDETPIGLETSRD